MALYETIFYRQSTTLQGNIYTTYIEIDLPDGEPLKINRVSIGNTFDSGFVGDTYVTDKIVQPSGSEMLYRVTPLTISATHFGNKCRITANTVSSTTFSKILYVDAEPLASKVKRYIGAFKRQD